MKNLIIAIMAILVIAAVDAAPLPALATAWHIPSELNNIWAFVSHAFLVPERFVVSHLADFFHHLF